MLKNKFLQAFRLKTKISSDMLKTNRELRNTNNERTIVRLVIKHDSLQKRLQIADKYLKL